MKRRIILLGPPASGKGTQARLLAEKYGLPSASTGAMLREERARGTDIGREADAWTRDGKFFPDEIALRVVRRWLEENVADAFLLDGFPRTLGQARAFDAEPHVSIDAVLHLVVSDEVIRSRVNSRITCAQCGASFSAELHRVREGDACPACGHVLVRRRDDTAAALEERLLQHRVNTGPVIDYYERGGRLANVSGEADRETVLPGFAEHSKRGARVIPIKRPPEIEKMRAAGDLAAEVLNAVVDLIAPGITTGELDRHAAKLIADAGAKSAFFKYRGFPGQLCISINEEVVHGIGGERKVNYGDVVSLDCGVNLNGWIGDTAITVPVGIIDPAVERLLHVTEDTLMRGIQLAVAGRRLGDMCNFIETEITRAGFSVVREFVGHGVGRQLHEDPQVPNYGRKGSGPKLKAGMVLAVEPMVNMGRADVRILADKWTVVTKDGLPSAHFEHTILITNEAPEVLTWRRKTLLK